MGLCAKVLPAERPMGAGQSRPPVGTCGANKRAVQVCMSLHSPKAHKPMEITLVKQRNNRYNERGASYLAVWEALSPA